jgi:hypothetical protein
MAISTSYPRRSAVSCSIALGFAIDDAFRTYNVGGNDRDERDDDVIVERAGHSFTDVVRSLNELQLIRRMKAVLLRAD